MLSFGRASSTAFLKDVTTSSLPTMIVFAEAKANVIRNNMVNNRFNSYFLISVSSSAFQLLISPPISAAFFSAAFLSANAMVFPFIGLFNSELVMRMAVGDSINCSWLLKSTKMVLAISFVWILPLTIKCIMQCASSNLKTFPFLLTISVTYCGSMIAILQSAHTSVPKFTFCGPIEQEVNKKINMAATACICFRLIVGRANLLLLCL